MFSELTKKETPPSGTIDRSIPRPEDPSHPSHPLKTTEKIESVVMPILRSLGLELFEIQFSGSMTGGHLKIFIDKAAGVTVDDCAKVSRFLNPALDIDEDMPRNYTLEVSSPGIDRPLRTEADFRRHIGKKIKIVTYNKIEDRNRFIGRLIDFKEHRAFLVLDGGAERAIPFDQIESARLEVEMAFGQKKGGLKK